MHKFVSCLRCPSNRHTLLDMSTSLPPPLTRTNRGSNNDTTIDESMNTGTGTGTSNKNQLFLLETLMTSMNIPSSSTTMIMTTIKNDPLCQPLLPGTSIERLQLERERQQNHRRRNRYPQIIDPGMHQLHL